MISSRTAFFMMRSQIDVMGRQVAEFAALINEAARPRRPKEATGGPEKAPEAPGGTSSETAMATAM